MRGRNGPSVKNSAAEDGCASLEAYIRERILRECGLLCGLTLEYAEKYKVRSVMSCDDRT